MTFENRIDECKKNIAELNEKGIKQIKIAKKFELAGMQDDDNIVYKLLSRDSHNTVDSLVIKHIIEKENEISYVFDKKYDKEQIIPYLHHLVEILFRTFSYILKIHNHEVKNYELIVESYDDIVKKIEEL